VRNKNTALACQSHKFASDAAPRIKKFTAWLDCPTPSSKRIGDNPEKSVMIRKEPGDHPFAA
jgi:hypothetical protein